MIKPITDFSHDYDKKALHPLQSWSWGQARKEMGIEVFRLGEYTNNELANVFQLSFHKIPFTNYKIGYLPRSVFPSKNVLEFLYEYGKKNNVIFIKIEPYVLKSEIRSASWRRKFETESNSVQTNSKFKIISSKHPLFPKWTIILDLTKSDEELLKAMHHKTRYNIRLAQRKGVIVKEMSSNEGFEIFSKLYFDTCRRQKYFGHTKKYHQIVWNSLKNNIAHILVAFYKSKPLAAFEIFYFHGTAYYPYGGTSPEHRNLMASNLLMWEAVRLAKKLGAKKFDFWGSLPPNYDKNHPWAGFTRFKAGYGGSFIKMIGSFDLIINPLIYRLYSYFYILRQLYLKIRRKI